MDKARAHRAKQELHSERDKLLKRGSTRISSQANNAGDGKDQARALVWTVAILVPATIAYASVMLAWFYMFNSSMPKFLAVFLSYLLLAVVLMLLSFKWLTGRARPWLWWIGFWMGQATLAALVIGFFVYYRNLVYYWKYQEMRSYTNVAAAQDDAAFPDANMFLFTEDTRLDTQRAVGYQSRWTGQVYCVAPLVDTTMSTVAPIYYWAIGEDCCEARAAFQCGDAQDPSTRSGLVALNPSDIVRPFMRWAVQGSPYERFERAVRLEEATYVTQAAPEPTFVYWSRDPVALKDSFFTSATQTCLTASLIAWAIFLVLIYGSAWRLVPRRKLEGVMRYAA
mmetsp:Transcript_61538/g.144130  ORF Transcript_61538/g.144130 Transcript_61538/m.144130 type:complete len:339 (+) Transcript_61538:56-1072(+)